MDYISQKSLVEFRACKPGRGVQLFRLQGLTAKGPGALTQFPRKFERVRAWALGFGFRVAVSGEASKA